VTDISVNTIYPENSPKSGLRQDTTVPVPFLSFESLRGHSDVSPISATGSSGAQYTVGGSGLTDSMVLDKLVDDSGKCREDRPWNVFLLGCALCGDRGFGR
jgi:hypothetical protein